MVGGCDRHLINIKGFPLELDHPLTMKDLQHDAGHYFQKAVQ
jgi:hypothetical protein